MARQQTCNLPTKVLGVQVPPSAPTIGDEKMYLSLMELGVLVLFVVVMISQVIIPLWKGTSIFPMCEQKNKKPVEKQLEEVDDELVEAKLMKEVKTKKQRVKKMLLDEGENDGDKK